MIEFSFDSIVLPINPPNYLTPRDAENKTVNVVGLGDVIIPATPGLISTSIECHFPYYVVINGITTISAVAPIDYVNFFNAMWETKKPLRFIVTDLHPVNMLVILNHFEYDRRAGDHEDIYYTMQLTEYRPYGATIINQKDGNSTTPIAEQRSEENKPPVEQTYTVKPNDSIIGITKQARGSDLSWRDLYNANKEIIGNNPDLIQPGTILKIPDGWVT
jgi:hypothetical protein